VNTLKEYHDAILAAVREEFGDVLRTVDGYAPERVEDVKTPALLLDLESWSPGEDTGDGKTALRCTVTAHCILSFQTEGVHLEVREFGARVHQLVRGNRWGLGGDVEPPGEAIDGAPGFFKPGKDGYDSWCVTWEQVIYLGQSAWAGTATPITNVSVNVNGHELGPVI
jgi:hypothetical protein